MMNDAYTECLVKQQPSSHAAILKGALFLLCAISLCVTIIFPFGIIALIGFGGVTYFTLLNMDLEFEYLYINGQLTIDKIMGKSKRKTVWEGELDQAQIIAASDSDAVRDHSPVKLNVIDCSSRQQGCKTYTLISQKGQETAKVIFEPSDTMLQMMRQKYPSKVKL